MSYNFIQIREANKDDSKVITALMDQHWGGEPLVVRAKKYFPSQLPGIIAYNHDSIAGFLFYTITDVEIEIIVFEVFDKFKGLGSKILDKLKELARSKGIKRIFLMTNNDNIDALRFYQRRGFHICGIHLNSVELSRKIKPSIGYIGEYGIPLRDEIDLELLLD